MNFSAGVRITGLNDFLGPEKDCIVNQINPKPGKIEEVQINTAESKLEPAKISLTDCLACSGCVTSAESILIESQGAQEFIQGLKQPNRVNVVTISPQALSSLATYYNVSVPIVFGKLNTVLSGMGVHHVLSTCVALDIGLLYAANEFVTRKKRASAGLPNAVLPTITAECPGWVCYAEKTHGDFILPYLSNVKPAQQIMGSILQGPFREALGLPLHQAIYHVAVMQCYDKKLEASRPDFKHQVGSELRSDVDMVLAATELAGLIDHSLMSNAIVMPLTHPLATLSLMGGPSAGSSGGYLDFIFRYAAKELYGLTIDAIQYTQGRNPDIQECKIVVDGNVLLTGARAYGFRNIQNIVRRIKSKTSPYDYVEVMACPGGCANGGGADQADT